MSEIAADGIMAISSPSTDSRPEQEPRPFKAILPRILRLALVHWRLVVVASSLSLTVSLLWMIPPFLISLVIDRAILGGDTRLLYLLSGGLLGAALLIAIFNFLEDYCLALLGERVVRSLRIMMFEALQRQSHRFFVHTSSGAIVSRMWNDVSGIHLAVSSGVAEIFSSLVLLVVTLTIMFTWEWTLAILSISLLPLVFGVSLLMGKFAESIGQVLFEKLDGMTSFTFERFGINGFTLLSGFGYDKSRDSKRFANDTEELLALSVRQNLTVQAVVLTLGLFTIVSSLLIYLYGGLKIIDDELSLGTLTAFIALSVRIAWPIANLSNISVNVLGSMAPFRRVFEWIDLTPEITDRPDAHELRGMNGHIVFRDVSFEYEHGSPVLRNLSFEVLPGQLAALVGPSGAGKTTATYMMLRFYDPTMGSIEIDGNDLRDIKLSSLRRFTSIVPQENIVFNTTVRENLLIAKPDATEDEIAIACEAAQLQEFISSLPDGFDSVVGEFGYALSGGERQRLAIARAILKQPRLLIMDEPTSSLDSINERTIRDALTSMLTQSTTIVIAHRLSTILSADTILVLDEGHFVDSGRHEELLRRCELYRRLYEEQFSSQSP